MLSNYIKRLDFSSYWKDIAWVISGNGAANLLAIAALPLLTRLYSAEDFAIQALFIQLVGFVAVLISLRFELLIQLPKDSAGAKSLLLLIILLSAGGVLTLTPLAFAFRGEIAQLLGEEQISAWLTLVPITAALLSLALAVQHYLQRNQLYRLASLSELASKSSYIAIAIIGFWIFPRPAGLIFAQSFASIGKLLYMLLARVGSLSNIIGQVGLFERIRHRSEAIPGIVNEHRKLAGGLVYSQLLQASAVLLPSAFILKTYGAETLGQYAIVQATIFLPSGLIGKAIGKVYYQRAAKLWSAGQNSLPLWRSTAAKVFALGLPIYALVGLFAETLYPLVFGSNWLLAGSVAQAMAISAFVNFITSPFSTTSWVIGVWWYSPLWGTLRILLTGLAIWLAGVLALDAMGFIWLLVAQQSITYLVDGISQRYFAARQFTKKM